MPVKAARRGGPTLPSFRPVSAQNSRTACSMLAIDHSGSDFRRSCSLASVWRAAGSRCFPALSSIAKGRWAALDDLANETHAVASARVEEMGNGQVSMPDGLGEHYGLTDREEEILRLLTRRLSDKEIADQLSISARTVNRHVSNVLAKLEVSSRREAAAIGDQLRIG